MFYVSDVELSKKNWSATLTQNMWVTKLHSSKCLTYV